MRAAAVSEADVVRVSGQVLKHAATFAAVGEGEAFWYGNSSGLVEIAVNRGSAAEKLGLEIGYEFHMGA